ncbi:MAG: 2-hydroxyglutaryl-CoA dehydratase [Clostridiales bacterium]|jgi:predicted nucleotide-binding protein (sugar kinase/HSP70/actin superfamily)|nr:2-hydroxyglutaryl-CoA dehydratase [Clostridiales bacterium]
MIQPKVQFTEEMKKDYTILIPTMLPMHFKMIAQILTRHGYKTELLENCGQNVKDCGLKYVHNDTCYPALLVIGQFLDAIQSGKYDSHKVALMLTQTGGGCRASNYIALLRKALEKAGYGYIPVISLNISGLEENPGFKLTLPLIRGMIYAVLYGDLLMTLRNQCRPYEVEAGMTDVLCDKWTKYLADELFDKKVSYQDVKKNYAAIVRDFDRIPRRREKKIKVGIVGEIFVKFSPLGNNNLEDFLVSQGAEVSMPGLIDFCMYCIYNGIVDTKLYGIGKLKCAGSKAVYQIMRKMQNDLITAIRQNSSFAAPTPIEHTRRLVNGYIGMGAKMGEGWLLPAEMLELIDSGVNNIVCAQPFGCLPNHIVGKGMMKPIKERHPNVNIVAIDYDPGATKINQENRIKLMLSCAAENAGIIPQSDSAEIKEAVLHSQERKASGKPLTV